MANMRIQLMLFPIEKNSNHWLNATSFRVPPKLCHEFFYFLVCIYPGFRFAMFINKFLQMKKVHAEPSKFVVALSEK